MSRTPLSERKLPRYTRGEDIANMVTHIVGGAIGVVVLVFAILVSVMHQNVWGIVSGSIYGFSMIALYAISSVYHGLRPGYGKKVMQVLDHCTIYLLILGTYTPVLLSAIRPVYPVTAWVIFGVEIALVALGTVFTAIDHTRYARLSMLCYLGMGWCIILALHATVETVGMQGFLWLLAGGVAYTLGAVIYGIGSRIPAFHIVFHVFVDIGTVLQAVAILGYIL